MSIISGTGAENDPFIIESYYDFANCKGSGYGDSPTWVVLNNDIDCNDYGSDFMWQTQQLYGSSVYGESAMHVDLDGHTIKNVAIASGNSMFDLRSTSELKNGKLRNIFCNGAGGCISGSATIKNLGISANLTGIAGYAFNGIFIDACAIYVESAKLTYMPFKNTNEQYSMFTNSDIQLAINDLNGKRIIGKDTDFGGSSIGLTGSRIRGYVKGTYGTSTAIMGTCTAVDSVCDVDFTGITANLLGTANVFASGTGGVCNTDLHPSNFNITGGGTIINVTSQEIINGDALRAKGFVVVNVSA